MKCPTRHLLKWGSLLKSFLYFHIPRDKCSYSFTFYLVFLVFFSTRFLFTHFEFANYFFFFHNNWVLYLLILAAALLQLRSLRLWKALKNKSELSSYKTDIFLALYLLPRRRITLFRLVMDWVLQRQEHHHAQTLTQGCFLSFQIWIYRVLVYLELHDQS